MQILTSRHHRDLIPQLNELLIGQGDDSLVAEFFQVRRQLKFTDEKAGESAPKLQCRRER